MLTLHSTWLAKLMKGQPVVLVRDGVEDRQAMRRHEIGEDDLLEGLRLEQVERPEEVRLATLENNGRLSVVRQRSDPA
jgi:uncharacterized membrane protein YcaP (DUF421 family)